VTRLSESRHQPVYIDCNVLSPKTKTEIAGTLAETGCGIIDGAIVGAPPQPGEKGPRFYVSGDQSGRASVLRALRLDVRQIDGPIGAAAALKMSYSGISKGLTEIGAAMLLAASRSGASIGLYQAWVRVCRNCSLNLKQEYPTCTQKLTDGLQKCVR
jgi:3-hydroxyisobutyrate dehydrogenase-like beta-hydroxyacid dehydrogenase